MASDVIPMRSGSRLHLSADPAPVPSANERLDEICDEFISKALHSFRIVFSGPTIGSVPVNFLLRQVSLSESTDVRHRPRGHLVYEILVDIFVFPAIRSPVQGCKGFPDLSEGDSIQTGRNSSVNVEEEEA